MNKAISILMIFYLVLIVAMGCKKTTSESDDTERIPVDISVVKLGNLSRSLEYNGDISAEHEVKVFSKIPDRIEHFYVDEGDVVKKGAPIARVLAVAIEQGVLQSEAALAAAQAQEANLKVEFERATRLYRENAMSQQQYESIKTQYESVQAQVKQARAALISMRSQLDDATITAPIAGVVGKKYYETGDMAQPSMPLVKIVQMKRVKVEFDATEEDIGKLAVGQSSSVTVKAFPDKAFTGQVYRISPILDPLTRMAEVEVLVDNPDGLLKPGMFAEVEVIIGTIEEVIVIPRYSVIENTSLRKIEGEDRVVRNYYVFVVDSNQAVQKKLDILYANHRWLAVESGLKIGDRLVVSGQNNLRDGLAVAVNQSEEE